jgi:ribosomal protein L37AE/L43A
MNKLRLKLYELYARYHLKYTCPKCPRGRRAARDIFKEGECFWYRNWQGGTYNIRTYQTYILFKKLGIEKDLFLK